MKITNSGNVTAERVRLRVSGRGIAVNQPVGTIGAGVSRSVTVWVRPQRTGKILATFKAVSNNAGSKTFQGYVWVR